MTGTESMKKTMLQFHSTPTELVEILKQHRIEVGFSIAVIYSSPFSLKLFSKTEAFDLDSLVVGKGGNFRIAISTNDFSNGVSTQNSFFDNHPGCVVVDIGCQSSRGLEESAVSSMSSDPIAIKFSDSLVSKIKKVTRTGVVAVNPKTHAESKLRNYRFTIGAKMLFDRGVKILPVAGNSILKFL